jgi:tetratricopeptide (TPR) repeat protein
MKRFGLAISLTLLAFAALLSGCQNPALTGGKVYIQQQDWVKAKEQLELAVQQEPGNAEAHFLLGRVYGEQGAYQGMVKEFQASLEISPKWKTNIESISEEKWVMTFNRGVAAGKEENFEKAVEAFQTATIINPQKADAYNNLGFAYTNLGRLDEALEAYGKVLELQPENVAARINSGVIYLNRGETSEAADFFGRALEAEPGNKNALSMRALCLETIARKQKASLQTVDIKEDSLKIEEQVRSTLDQAIAVYNQAIEAHPDDKNFYYNLGVLYAQDLSDFQAAKPMFQKVSELDPGDVDAWFNLATTQLALDDLQGARPSLEMVLELEPDNSIAWYQLGVIYIKTGMKTEGEEAFKKAEELQSSEE